MNNIILIIVNSQMFSTACENMKLRLLLYQRLVPLSCTDLLLHFIKKKVAQTFSNHSLQWLQLSVMITFVLTTIITTINCVPKDRCLKSDQFYLHQNPNSRYTVIYYSQLVGQHQVDMFEGSTQIMKFEHLQLNLKWKWRNDIDYKNKTLTLAFLLQ